MQTRMTLSEAYRILGLSNEATLAEVKTAYRRKVAEAHPDRGGTAAEFIRVRAAYEILCRLPRAGARRLRRGRAGAQPRPGPPAAEDEEVPIPEDLRAVIDRIVAEFREHQRWAEAETLQATRPPSRST